jgi:hypothetical protein
MSVLSKRPVNERPFPIYLAGNLAGAVLWQRSQVDGLTMSV